MTFTKRSDDDFDDSRCTGEQVDAIFVGIFNEIGDALEGSSAMNERQALRHFRQWSEADRLLITETLAKIRHEWGDVEFYAVESDTYVGVAAPPRTVAYLHVGFILHHTRKSFVPHDTSEAIRVELSGHKETARGPAREDTVRPACPECWVELPEVGDCGFCQ